MEIFGQEISHSRSVEARSSRSENGDKRYRRKVSSVRLRVCIRQEAYLIVCWQLFASTSGSDGEESERERVSDGIHRPWFTKVLAADTLMTDERTQHDDGCHDSLPVHLFCWPMGLNRYPRALIRLYRISLRVVAFFLFLFFVFFFFFFFLPIWFNTFEIVEATTATFNWHDRYGVPAMSYKNDFEQHLARIRVSQYLFLLKTYIDENLIVTGKDSIWEDSIFKIQLRFVYTSRAKWKHSRSYTRTDSVLLLFASTCNFDRIYTVSRYFSSSTKNLCFVLEDRTERRRKRRWSVYPIWTKESSFYTITRIHDNKIPCLIFAFPIAWTPWDEFFGNSSC